MAGGISLFFFVTHRASATVAALRGAFAGSLPIWEGHVRVGLQELVVALESHSGDPDGISVAAVEFLQRVATIFIDDEVTRIRKSVYGAFPFPGLFGNEPYL